MRKRVGGRGGARFKILSRRLALAAAGSLGLALPAHAQHYSSIVGFGDSYVDTGNAVRADPALLATYPTGRFSGGTNYVDTLSAIYRLPVLNLAWGGATTGAIPGPVPSFALQTTGFLGLGGAVPPSSLLLVNIGGNDADYYAHGGGSLAGAPTAAAGSAALATTSLKALVASGARTLVWTAGDAGGLPYNIASGPAIAGVASAYSHSYNNLMQPQLARIAAAGVRVEYVDLSLLQKEIYADPARFGVANPGVCPASCIGNPAQQSQYLFYVDGIHLTSLGFAILGEYIANRLNAPETIAPASDLSLYPVSAFAGALMARMDLFNAPGLSASSGFLAYAGPGGVDSASGSPWQVYIQPRGGLGSRSSAGNAAGYDWSALGGSIGLEYRLAANWLVGGALDMTGQYQTLNGGAGSSQLQSTQLGLYSAWSGRNLFAQGVVSFGWLDYSNSRPGVVSTITSSPTGETFGLAAKTGYLFDINPSTRLGPILGVIYAQSNIGAYNESGDPLLTLNVAKQNLEATLGSAGAQLRQAFEIGGDAVDTFLNVTAENNFQGYGRVIQFSALSAPLIVNTYDAQQLPNHAFARVALGAEVKLTSSMSSTLYLSQTVGQPGGQDFAASGALNWSF